MTENGRKFLEQASKDAALQAELDSLSEGEMKAAAGGRFYDVDPTDLYRLDEIKALIDTSPESNNDSYYRHPLSQPFPIM